MTEETTVEDLLAEARSKLRRLPPRAALDALADGAIIVDIRSEVQLQHDGTIPGAVHHPRNVLEWRIDPSSPHRDETIAQRGRQVILVCDRGFQSSLAAATALRFGVRATDIVGGFQAWRAAGLPVGPPPGEE